MYLTLTTMSEAKRVWLYMKRAHPHNYALSSVQKSSLLCSELYFQNQDNA